MPKPSLLDRAIQNVNEKIAALELAKQHLLEEQRQATKKKSRPHVVPRPDERPAS
jgi:hypothetical protein